VGTQVWGSGGDIGFTRDGSHAEFLMIPAEAVSPKPGNLSYEQAACVGVNFLTAYQGLFRCAKLQVGETLLVTGSQGCNSARPTTLSSSPWAASPLCGKASPGSICSAYVDISKDNLREAVQELTEGKGVDVAFDCVGGELFEPVLSTLGLLGRQVVITSAAPRRVRFDIRDFYYRRLTLLGVDSLSLTVTDGASLLNSLAPLFEAGHLRPASIAKYGTLDEARELYSTSPQETTARRCSLSRTWGKTLYFFFHNPHYFPQKSSPRPLAKFRHQEWSVDRLSREA